MINTTLTNSKYLVDGNPNNQELPFSSHSRGRCRSLDHVTRAGPEAVTLDRRKGRGAVLRLPPLMMGNEDHRPRPTGKTNLMVACEQGRTLEVKIILQKKEPGPAFVPDTDCSAEGTWFKSRKRHGGLDEAHFWLNGYVKKQNCRIWSEANPQVYVETPLHPEKLTVWCALWAGGILLQKR
ncbi:ankyrin-2 [Trichonephila clavipes]|nr:ankyrin-2 [Trichonephila clavipes]